MNRHSLILRICAKPVWHVVNHALPGCPAAHCGANGIDYARGFNAGNQGQIALVGSRAHEGIAAVDADGSDTHTHLASARRGQRTLGALQNLGPTVSVYDDNPQLAIQ